MVLFALCDFIFWGERDWDSGFYHYSPDLDVPEELLKLKIVLDPSSGDSDSVGMKSRALFSFFFFSFLLFSFLLSCLSAFPTFLPFPFLPPSLPPFR